jgi:hypothetical protein
MPDLGEPEENVAPVEPHSVATGGASGPEEPHSVASGGATGPEEPHSVASGKTQREAMAALCLVPTHPTPL